MLVMALEVNAIVTERLLHEEWWQKDPTDTNGEKAMTMEQGQESKE